MKQVKSCLWHIMSLVIRDDGPKVIYYHDIGGKYTTMGTPLCRFRAHIEAARRNGWSFVSGVPSRNRELMLCFDDGFRGILEARDVIMAEQLRPTVFIAVDLIGRPGYLTWGEILDLQKDGFIFQSHTWSHQTLAGEMINESPIEERTDAWFDRELRQSREVLSERLGYTVDSLCFPVGYFSDEVIRRARDVGYRYLFASFPGKMPNCEGLRQDSVVIPRFLVQNCSVSDLKAILRGGMDLFKRHYLKQHYVSTRSRK